MEKAYLNKNIVISGDFKPANFDKLFLVKRNIIQETDFEDSSVFLPDYAQIHTPAVEMLVKPDNVTINFKDPEFKFDSEKVGALIGESDIRVFGINFKKALILEDTRITADYFYFENNKLNEFFPKEGSLYGYFITREFPNYRLTLNVKPVRLQKINEEKIYEAMEFTFNFRFDGSNIIDRLSEINEFEEITDNIIHKYDTFD